MKKIKIADLRDMPDFNWETQKNRDTWSTQDVTDQNVTLDPVWNKPRCIDHNAMNAVNADRSIWRCLICGRACYAVFEEVDSSDVYMI